MIVVKNMEITTIICDIALHTCMHVCIASKLYCEASERGEASERRELLVLGVFTS